MDSTILNAKPLFIKNGEQIVNLCEPVLGQSNTGIRIIDLFYVSDMEMRPDLVSYVAYRTENYFDFVLKFNGISNPYSLDKDTIVFIPEISDFKTKFNTVKKKEETKGSEFNIRDQYIEKTTNIDPRRAEFHNLLKTLKNKGMNVAKDLFPPTIQEEGKNEANILENSVIF